jgi:hypothetical protein
MQKKPTKPKRVKTSSTVTVDDAAERAVVEAALRAFRTAKTTLPKARDPKASREALTTIFQQTDELAQLVVAAAEEDSDDEEDDEVDVDGVKWRSVGAFERTYHSTRGPIRVKRRLYRSKRNGPTRCLYDERRGVIEGLFLPDLGRAVVMAVADLPAEGASRLLEAATGHPIATATMKRTTTAVGNALRDEEAAFLEEVVDHQAIPPTAVTVAISVDALSFRLREQGYKQACVATVSLLDDVGERLATIRIGEMPESGKQTIMDRVEREVRSLLDRQPKLDVVVVIDGAVDLRRHLLARFPFARHITDYFHVVEHIAAGLREIPFDSEATRAAQRRSFCHRLKHDDDAATEIIQWLRDSGWVHPSMSDEAKAVVDAHANYVENQLPYLDYVDALAHGMDIGSGAVEAACKTLVTQRLKVSGATWSETGARAILHLRSTLQSGRFSDALDFHAVMQAA